ncbi:DEAD/DEAH box helicase [Echinicola jeungdonensis]|uniref:DEAD/DEAH box helicase n=1 Tax=Echinicola jeungdonensis TaxID=709343 RepID=A0ABV5J6T1_9BACT|nr:DEAD/DEAH box helicase [Echinicola jeungdonensis]MDN3670827.1 DEAD/DEAH box helicase [Echinicola jeungdonensis]
MDVVNFTSFNFNVALQEGLNAMGFDNPTPIQAQAIPKIMEGKDLIACAQTGTGKTAAFILPIINKIAESGKDDLNTLILAPTRELAIQIDQQIQGLAYFAGVSSLAIYGGGDGITWERQKKALEHGTGIIVATPGRLIALMAGGKINFSTLQHLVLDEADRMLDMGFSDDILKIINYLPQKRQTVLFSATMPENIRKFSKKILHHPEEINIAISKTAEGVTQMAYLAYDNQKEDLLQHILGQKDYEAVIIFASTKEKVKSIYKTLKKKFEVEGFHSDLDQMEREKIMSRFKNKTLKILVGTDILSRGIDVEGIELVINYDTPGDPEDYVHRVGRTARADMKGEAITFINEKDQGKFSKIERLIGLDIPKEKLPEELGNGPEYSPVRRKPKGEPSRKPNKKFGNKPQQKAKPSSNKTQKSPSKKPEESPSKSTNSQGKFRKRHNVQDMNKD